MELACWLVCWNNCQTNTESVVMHAMFIIPGSFHLYEMVFVLFSSKMLAPEREVKPTWTGSRARPYVAHISSFHPSCSPGIILLCQVWDLYPQGYTNFACRTSGDLSCVTLKHSGNQSSHGHREAAHLCPCLIKLWLYCCSLIAGLHNGISSWQEMVTTRW